MSAERSLLVITDPAARSADGESVRVALDVLRACAPSKIVIPTDPADLQRALARRGRRRVVVIGGDAGVHAVARLLDRAGELGETPLGIVPIDTGSGHGLARALGLPAEPAKAARVALGENERSFDLMSDDLGGLALRSVRIGHGVRAGRAGAVAGMSGRGWRGLWDQAARTVSSTVGAAVGPSGHRLRIEADGRVVADTDRPVLSVHLGCDGSTTPGPMMTEVTVNGYNGRNGTHGANGSNGAGTATVMITGHPGASRFGPHPALGAPVQLRAHEITVRGRDFTYAADGMPTGPVHLRTWTVRPTGWRLFVPA
ncbi:diacylglycerol kinase family protein [Embleya scabrispora]|uniref:diacylglycerol kinase family protein n=1 Tax=Embleya scabrispora TaxID=159449 RepID=UPI001374A078|nr:diacylglycerol kinase family protein [Embleya scabrispora]